MLSLNYIIHNPNTKKEWKHKKTVFQKTDIKGIKIE